MSTVIVTAVALNIDVFAEKPAARTAANLEPVAHAAATADVPFVAAVNGKEYKCEQKGSHRKSERKMNTPNKPVAIETAATTISDAPCSILSRRAGVPRSVLSAPLLRNSGYRPQGE